MSDTRSSLGLRRAKPQLSLGYSRQITRKGETKRDNNFKIRKASSSKMSSPQINVANRIQMEQESLKRFVSADAWIVHDSIRKKTYGNRHTIERQIASLTKIMTCIVVLEQIEKHNIDFDVMIRVSRNAAAMAGTSANLPYGYWLRITDLLHGMMLPSGNDAACLLAEAFGLLMFYEKIKPEENLYENILSIDLNSYDSTSNFAAQFIKAMNKKSKQLGLSCTSFTNPHGMMTSINLSSAKDILALTKYCHQNPQFMKIASTKQYTAKLYLNPENPEDEYNLQWKNTNKLLDMGWQGIKTGHTTRAGACLASVKNNIFIVVLSSTDSEKRFQDSINLYEWYVGQQRVSCVSVSESQLE